MEGLNLPGDPAFYAVAAFAVVLLGLSKGGFAGMGTASMPLVALVMDPLKAAAMLLPILILQDVVGVWAFRHSFDARTLAWSIPGGIFGTFLGWLTASVVAIWVVEAMVGALAIVFGAYRLFQRYGMPLRLSTRLPDALGLFWGSLAGFTSQIALAGGPPFQTWALTRGFSPQVFVGTSAIFYMVINWAKVPAFFALGQFTWDTLQLTLLFIPLAVLSTFAGVALVKRVSAERFGLIIDVLLIAVGLRLVQQAFG